MSHASWLCRGPSAVDDHQLNNFFVDTSIFSTRSIPQKLDPEVLLVKTLRVKRLVLCLSRSFLTDVERTRILPARDERTFGMMKIKPTLRPSKLFTSVYDWKLDSISCPESDVDGLSSMCSYGRVRKKFH